MVSSPSASAGQHLAGARARNRSSREPAMFRTHQTAIAVVLVAWLNPLLAQPAGPPLERLRLSTYDVRAQTSGILLVLGTPIEKGKKIPAADVITVDIGGEKKRFRRLHPGELIK